MNLGFTVFHIEGINKGRDYCYRDLTGFLSKYVDFVPTPTVMLSNNQEVKEFLDATPEFSINYATDYWVPGNNFPHKAGVVGVWASNYLAWKALLDSDKDALLIFEDDVILGANFPAILGKYMAELPPDWDIFSFFVPEDTHVRYNDSHKIEGRSYVCRNYQDWSCAGYMISRSGAQKAMDDIAANGVSAPVDWYVFDFEYPGHTTNVFNGYCLKPTAYVPMQFFERVSKDSYIHATESMQLGM